MGWARKRNRELLRVAEREFDAFLTIDGRLLRQRINPAATLRDE
jgi:hypothetical protein